jgi:hypothetical protein
MTGGEKGIAKRDCKKGLQKEVIQSKEDNRG